MAKLIGAFALCLSLAACGGSGGQGGGIGAPSGSLPFPLPVPAATDQAKNEKADATSDAQGLAAQQADQGGATAALRAQGPEGLVLFEQRSLLRSVDSPSYSYKLGRVNFADLSAFEAELNSAEMTGFIYYGNAGSGASTGGEVRAIYQKRGDAVGYSHRIRLLSEVRTRAGFQAQGADGYLINSYRVDGQDINAVLSKAAGQGTTYEYAEVENSLMPGETVSSSLAALNKLGQQGFCKAEISWIPEGRVLLGREIPTASRCTFHYRVSPSSYRATVAMLNEEGAAGARYALHTLLEYQDWSLFVRDETRRTVFRYHIVEMPSTAMKNPAPEDWVAFLNREGALGAKPLQSFDEADRSYMIFMTSYSCKGLLC